MMELLVDPQAWVSLAVLTLMEVVLGIDNIVFITILCGRLPKDKQLSARRLGLAVALASRLVLLLGIAWVMRLTEPLFTLVVEWTGKDLILFGGGLFLLYKSTPPRSTKTSSTPENTSRPRPTIPTARGRKRRATGESWRRSWCSTSCSRSTR